MTQTQPTMEERLREEWKEYCYSQDPRRILTPKEIADFWLSKQSTRIEKMREFVGSDEDVSQAVDGTPHKFAILGRNQERARIRNYIDEITK